MKVTLIVLGLFGALLRADGQTPSVESTNQQAAATLSDYERLRTAEEFSMGAIGVAPKTSPNVAALSRILKTPAAAEDCKKLTREGTLVGQLYGLWGLKLLKDSSYAATAARYRYSRVEIDILSADIITKRPAFFAVQMIEGKVP